MKIDKEFQRALYESLSAVADEWAKQEQKERTKASTEDDDEIIKQAERALAEELVPKKDKPTSRVDDDELMEDARRVVALIKEQEQKRSDIEWDNLSDDEQIGRILHAALKPKQ